MKKLWFAVLLGSLATAVLVDAHADQQSKLFGRWVNMDLPDARLHVLYLKPDGTAYRLTSAQQGPMTYRLEAGNVLLKGDGGPTESLVLRGDTLLRNGQVFLTRLSDTPKVNSGVQGAWHLVWEDPHPRKAESGQVEEVFTFRSDGQVIVEMGFPREGTLTGDTLKLPMGSFNVRLVKDILYVESPGAKRRLVRRQWGCFGIPLDAPASECH